MEYLLDWFRELEAFRDVGEMGLKPLAPMIATWASLMDRCPTPLEVEALIALDGATRFPESGEEPTETEKPKRQFPGAVEVAG